MRDFGLIVTDGAYYFCEEKSGTESQVEGLEAGIPVFRVVNSCPEGHFRITKEILVPFSFPKPIGEE